MSEDEFSDGDVVQDKPPGRKDLPARGRTEAGKLHNTIKHGSEIKKELVIKGRASPKSKLHTTRQATSRQVSSDAKIAIITAARVKGIEDNIDTIHQKYK
jgi:hypothetical protein